MMNMNTYHYKELKITKNRKVFKGLSLGYIVVIIWLSLITLGCVDLSSDYSDVETSIDNTTNSTNTTLNQQSTLQINESLDNLFFFKSVPNCAFFVTKENISYLIDCGNEQYLNVIKEVKNLGISHIDCFIVTNPSKINAEFLDKLVLRFRPSVIYDTGLPSEYSDYKQFNFSNISLVSKNQEGMKVTYEDGFLTKFEFNTIIPYFSNEFVYMGDCYNECEDKINLENINSIYLANKGECETNSLMFIIKTNPYFVVSFNEVCDELKKDFEAMDMPIYLINQNTIHIVFNGDKYEVSLV